MKTIRLLYPDFVSGGMEEYYFGGNVLQYLVPQNPDQPVVKVDILPPTGTEKEIIDGIYGRHEVEHGILSAQEQLAAENPDRVITIGGNCLVSFAPFDYLHGKYEDAGIIWIDAHPDVSRKENGYPCAHAMVLGSLMGAGDAVMTDRMQNKPFAAKDILYVGLQGLHDYQEAFLQESGVNYKVQDEAFVAHEEIAAFAGKYEHVFVHFDIDVLDEHFFHSTYFANPDAGGDGAGGGKMKMEQLGEILALIDKCSSVEAFTIAEYLPFDEYKLHKMLQRLTIFA